MDHHLVGARPGLHLDRAASARQQGQEGYVVPEALFFRQPIVRETVSRQGRYVASEGKESVVAWPLKSSGVLIVGDGPVAELESLKS